MKQSQKVPYEYRIEKSNGNEDILIINGKYIHSRFKPSEEAGSFLCGAPGLIAVFGLGFAYHVNNILRNNPGSIFIIFEPCQEIFDLRKKYIDKELCQSSKDRILVINEIDEMEIYDFFLKNILITQNRLITYSNQGYKNIFPAQEKYFFESVKYIIQIFVQNTLTESNFIPLWTKNFIKNVRNGGNFLYVKNKQDRGNEVALIACAGPSLIRDISKIKDCREKITLFAVDTVVKPLLSCGIVPDLIVSLDGQYFSILDFPGKLPEDALLIADAVSYPGISGRFDNLIFTVTDNIFKGSLLEYFFDHTGINHSRIRTGGNISDYCLNLALLLGFKNIYFSGLDLSYPGLQTHCKGTPYYDNVITLSDYFVTPETQMISNISKRDLKETLKKNGDGIIFTDFVLQNYAFYLSKFAASDDANIYYDRTTGIRIDNFIESDLEDVIKESGLQRIKSNELVNNGMIVTSKGSSIKKFFEGLMLQIHKKALGMKGFLDNFNDKPADDIAHLKQAQIIYDEAVKEMPFLKKFIIMTELILQKKGIGSQSIVWYKHTLHMLLQSAYYIIRTIQKLI